MGANGKRHFVFVVQDGAKVESTFSLQFKQERLVDVKEGEQFIDPEDSLQFTIV